MSYLTIKYLILTIALYALQVMIFDHITLFGYATALIFIYPLISVPMDLNRNWLLTYAFLLGTAVDIWNDSLGVNALSCTILAVCIRPVFYLFTARDDKSMKMIPSIRSMGFWGYSKFAFLLCLIFCFLVFTIEYLRPADIALIATKAISSTVLTFILILGIDSIADVKK